MKTTNIWNPASKVLNFEEVEKRMQYRGVLYNFDFQDDYREINFPIDKESLFGEIALVEFYNREEGFYFLYWRDTQNGKINFDKYICKVDAQTGRTVEEGRGLLHFENKLRDDNFLIRKGVELADYGYIRESLPVFLKKLLSVINSEIKKTIRSNAEDFIESI